MMGKDDELEARLAELAELRELAKQAGDEDLLALIDQYMGEEVGMEATRFTEDLNSWLAGDMTSPRPDWRGYLMAAIGRACHRANLKLRTRPRG
ncbi:MAG: hypothetical protein B7X93_08475 [Hydrogenophilales bacterium 17-61-9]|nr:MAG: hypothetical protein B7X93_08475 [Hydrogenophilales bacterium 17-61-9]